MSHYQKVLIAIDLDQHAESIINSALKLCNEQTIIQLIHVVLPISQAFYANGMGLIEPMVDLVDLEKKVLDHAQQHLNSLTDKLIDQYQYENRVLKGDVVDSIVDFAKENRTSVIVLGSHATSGIKLLLGSTANGILHHAPCDTLMVKISE